MSTSERRSSFSSTRARWVCTVLTLTGGAEVRYVGERDDLDFTSFPFTRVTLAPYALVGLSAAVDLSGPGRPGLVLRGRADNLLDTAYQEVHGFRTPGRTLFFGVEVRFPS